MVFLRFKKQVFASLSENNPEKRVFGTFEKQETFHKGIYIFEAGGWCFGLCFLISLEENNVCLHLSLGQFSNFLVSALESMATIEFCRKLLMMKLQESRIHSLGAATHGIKCKIKYLYIHHR